ncbi:MAG: hypothetical protein NZ770_05050 [Candidatus Poseidoniaceae archaeon]|nr:hypothetical protein [Candidatus Poseidoniaceae archaeon]
MVKWKEVAIAILILSMVIMTCGGAPILIAKYSPDSGKMSDDDGDDNGGDDDDDDNPWEDGGESLGTAALVFLILTLSIVLWKPGVKLARKHLPDKLEMENRLVKKNIGIANRWFMKIHDWLGFGAALIGTLHGLLMDDWGLEFWIPMGGFWVLVTSGYLMRVKWPPKQVRKGARLLHMQRFIAIVSVIVLFIAHD